MATDASDHEQQRRELEEIRHKFAEVGKRMGSAFEPAAPDEHRERPFALAPPTAPPDGQPARPRWQWAAAMALIFVLGTGFGFVLPRGDGSSDPPPPPSTARSPVSTQAPQPQPVPSVPEVCLETARMGDQVIAKLMINDRDRRLAEALKAYTLASQACRKEASP
jgi:hypothetical protein